MSVANDIIEAIETAMKEIAGANGYGIDVSSVTVYDVDLLEMNKSGFPNVSIIDNGEESQVLPPDSNNDSLYEAAIILRGAVRGARPAKCQSELLTLEAAIKARIYATITQSSLIDIRVESLVDRIYRHDEDGSIGAVNIRCVLSYYVPGSAF